MILHICFHSSYISEPQTHSRAGGHFFLGPKSRNNTPITAMPPKNGPVKVEYNITRNLITPATEAELGGFVENFQKGTSILTFLAEMGHPQPPTPVATYNTESHSTVNGTAKQENPEQYTRYFIGCATEYDKIISTYSGRKERKTWQTISPNTTQFGTK